MFHCWRYKEPYSLSGCSPEVCVEPGDAEKERAQILLTPPKKKLNSLVETRDSFKMCRSKITLISDF